MDPFLLLNPIDDAPAQPALSAEEFVPLVASLSGAASVAVALSGGPDSMALAVLVHEWAQPRGIRVHAITVDHALRPEAAVEAQRVGAWVDEHMPGVTHAILHRDPALIRPTKLQEQARHDRYRLLADYCHAQSIQHLLLAHHQDDQAETFLFRLCKGSGLDGLAVMGMQSAVHDVALVRPFLGVGKDRLVATCVARGLPFVSDPSNGNDKFARVRLRRVMNVLAREGLSVKRLAVTAQRLARAREALDYYTDQTWRAALTAQSENELLFDLAALRQAPEDIRVRVLMRALSRVSGDEGYGPRLERVEELAVLLFTGTGFTRTTLHHCLVENSTAKGTLRISRETL